MNTQYFKQFEKYYNGEMDADEKASFEKSLTEDPDKDATFKEYLSIYEAIGDMDTMELRLKLQELRDERKRHKPGPDFFRYGYNWLWMAALLTIIISFTVIISLMITRVDRTDQFAYDLGEVSVSEYSDLDRELMRFEQRNMDFRLESPPADSIFLHKTDPLLFKWTVNSPDPVILELIDHQGHIVFTSGGPASSPYLVKKKLPGGMLIYRFRTQTVAYYIGFLFLK